MSRRKESHTDQEALLFKNTMQISRQQENLEEKPSFTSVWKLTVRVKISKKCNHFRKAAYFVALKKFKKSTLLGGIRPNHSADFSWFLLISVDLSWFQADFSFFKNVYFTLLQEIIHATTPSRIHIALFFYFWGCTVGRFTAAEDVH